jgi:hypothetical protein
MAGGCKTGGGKVFRREGRECKRGEGMQNGRRESTQVIQHWESECTWRRGECRRVERGSGTCESEL